MTDLIFSTGNAQKFKAGFDICATYGISLTQQDLDIEEIQHEDLEQVARRKAQTAYDIIKQPVLISDDGWSIPGLNGFPGAYMHAINDWLTADDFIRLTSQLSDRRIFAHKHLVYTDGSTTQLFSKVFEGTLLTEARGDNCTSAISMNGDNGLSITEIHRMPQTPVDRAVYTIWHDFAQWYAAR